MDLLLERLDLRGQPWLAATWDVPQLPAEMYAAGAPTTGFSAFVHVGGQVVVELISLDSKRIAEMAAVQIESRPAAAPPAQEARASASDTFSSTATVPPLVTVQEPIAEVGASSLSPGSASAPFSGVTSALGPEAAGLIGGTMGPPPVQPWTRPALQADGTGAGSVRRRLGWNLFHWGSDEGAGVPEQSSAGGTGNEDGVLGEEGNGGDTIGSDEGAFDTSLRDDNRDEDGSDNSPVDEVETESSEDNAGDSEQDSADAEDSQEDAFPNDDRLNAESGDTNDAAFKNDDAQDGETQVTTANTEASDPDDEAPRASSPDTDDGSVDDAGKQQPLEVVAELEKPEPVTPEQQPLPMETNDAAGAKKKKKKRTDDDSSSNDDPRQIKVSSTQKKTNGRKKNGRHDDDDDVGHRKKQKNQKNQNRRKNNDDFDDDDDNVKVKTKTADDRTKVGGDDAAPAGNLPNNNAVVEPPAPLPPPPTGKPTLRPIVALTKAPTITQTSRPTPTMKPTPKPMQEPTPTPSSLPTMKPTPLDRKVHFLEPRLSVARIRQMLLRAPSTLVDVDTLRRDGPPELIAVSISRAASPEAFKARESPG